MPPFDFDASKAASVAHMARLAHDPGWALYVRREAESWARRHPDEFGDLPQLLARAVRRPAMARVAAVLAVLARSREGGQRR